MFQVWHIAVGEKHPGRHNADTAAGLDKAVTAERKPFYPPELIIQDELHLITGPLGTIYGGYETVVEEMCCIMRNGKKIRPKYVVSTATIKNAGEQIKFLYGRIVLHNSRQVDSIQEIRFLSERLHYQKKTWLQLQRIKFRN